MTIILSPTLSHIIISVISFACSVNWYHFGLLFLMSMDTMSLAMEFKCLLLSVKSSIFIYLCMGIFTLFFDKSILEILGTFWTSKIIKNLWWKVLSHNLLVCYIKMFIYWNLLGKRWTYLLGQYLLLYYYVVLLTKFSIWMSCLYKKFYATLIII